MSAETVSGAPGKHARGYPKGRLRRGEIIRAATENFAQNGFTGATILDIANACRITRAGLLHHFADKETLLRAVLEERDREDRARFAPYVAGPSHGIGVLRGIVDLAGHNSQVPGLIDLFVRLSAEATTPDHPAHAYFTDRYRRIRRGTAHALAAAARAGYLREDADPAGAAVHLTALMDGLQAQWLFDAEIDMAAQMRHAVLGLLGPTGARAFDDFTLPPPE